MLQQIVLSRDRIQVDWSTTYEQCYRSIMPNYDYYIIPFSVINDEMSLIYIQRLDHVYLWIVTDVWNSVPRSHEIPLTTFIIPFKHLQRILSPLLRPSFTLIWILVFLLLTWKLELVFVWRRFWLSERKQKTLRVWLPLTYLSTTTWSRRSTWGSGRIKQIPGSLVESTQI